MPDPPATDPQGHPANLPPRHLTCLVIFEWIVIAAIAPSKKCSASYRFQTHILIEIRAQWLSLLHQSLLNVSIFQHRGCRFRFQSRAPATTRWWNHLELIGSDVALGGALAGLLLDDIVAVGDNHEEGAARGGLSCIAVWEPRIHYSLAAVGTGQVTRQTIHDHLVSKWECLLLCEHQSRCDILKCSLFARRWELLWHSDSRRCRWVGSRLWLSFPTTWARNQWQGRLLRGWRLAFNDCLQVPQLHLIQLLSLNRHWLIVDELIELAVLLEYHLRLASLVKISWWILWLAHTTAWSTTANYCFFAIVNFRITLSWIEISTHLQLVSLRYDSRISFFSIDGLLLSLVHCCIPSLNCARFISSIHIDSRLFFFIYGRYGRRCRPSSSVRLLFNSFIQSLLLFVLEQCLLIHLLLLFCYYKWN